MKERLELGLNRIAPSPANAGLNASTAPILRLRGVSKSFGATKALTDVSIDFDAGKIHCLLGENGAGKSTIGKIIGGLHRADSGVVLLDDIAVHISNPAHARSMGIAV